ncbi:MAG: DNA polymerase IV [Actinomycetaceae bacterium]|nr:DNA polymerase IV [Actinomycetaceae bacterium]
MSRAPRSPAARRFWGDDDSATNILHIDMDAFFVSVELLRRPELRGKPVAVGGQERGVISAASYEARAFGVNSAMPVAQAKRACPQLVILPPTMDLYAEVSQRVMKILHDVTPLVEQLSVDEAFLDVAGARKIFGSPVQIAQQIRAEIRRSEHIPASIGIASTKHVAKIASAHAKPDGWLLIPEEATLAFLHSLPVGALWGVGEVTRRRLEGYGVRTVKDLADLGRQTLIHLLGQAAGNQLYELAMGIDPRAVTPVREDKSYSREQTFFDPVTDRTHAEKIMLDQSHDAARRLRKNGMLARTVSIKVRFTDFSTITRSLTLGAPTATGADIYAAACQLFNEVTIPKGGIRLLGVKADQLSDAGLGLQLALDDDGRRSRAEEVMDSIRSKFGAGALSQASLLESDEDAGGRKRN